MKKCIKLIAIIALVSVLASCTKELSNVGSAEITAGFVFTKVNYAENDSNGLHPSWEIGDQVIGIYDNGTFTLQVSSILSDGKAVLKGSNVPKNASVHLIYKYGTTAEQWDDGLDVDYAAQPGNKTMPAIMFSEGTITDGSGDFMFENAGSVIGIVNANGVPEGASISKVIVKGENLSAAAVSINDNALTLTAASKADDKISTAALNGITVGTGSPYALSSPVFIAIPVGSKLTEIKLVSDKGVYLYPLASEKDVAENKYFYIKSGKFKEKEYYFTTSNDDYDKVDKTIYQIEFAGGNLYCNNASGFKYYFENNQWENRAMVAVGADKALLLQDGNIVETTPESTSGLFLWYRADDKPLDPANYGYGAFTKDILGTLSGSSADVLDWGDAYDGPGGWRTLTNNEWAYTIELRKVKGKSGYGNSCIWTKVYTGYKKDGEKVYMNGVLLFPDNWDDDDPEFHDGDMIPAHCVFLPAAGDRRRRATGEDGNKGSVENWGIRGMYWACTSKDGGTNADGPDFTSDWGGCDSDDRAYGMSVRLVRNLEQPAPEPPIGALSGKFTVNADGKQVNFSQGNLYWDGSNFKFEDAQTDYSSWSASHVSYFFWSNKADVAYANSYSDSAAADSDIIFTNKTLDTANPDFSVLVGDKAQKGLWRTLSINEWNYLINTRMVNGKTKYGNTCVFTTISSTKGLILFPDDYTGATTGLTSIPEGCVFLPAAGRRFTSGTMSEENTVSRYRGSDGLGQSSSTWAATGIAGGNGYVTICSKANQGAWRREGYSLRLVTDCK